MSDDGTAGADEAQGPAPSAAEEAEAAAFAAALEGRGDAPEDAAAAAALLRYSRDAGALDDASAARVLQAVLGDAPASDPVAGERPWWARPWTFLLPAGVGLAVAGAALVLTLRPGVPGGDLPLPDVALLRAQARAAEGAGSGELDEALTTYRGALHRRLGERYAP